MTKPLTLLLCGYLLLAGCAAEEPPPRSVSEFIDNPMLLEAAMVRCAQDRSKTKYEPECVNARQAVARIQAKEEAEARAALEARSERTIAARRRTQAAAAEARRRAEEARRKREETEYLSQFGVLPNGEQSTTDPLAEGNLPIAVVPDANDVTPTDDQYAEPPVYDDVGRAPAEPAPAEPAPAEPAPEPAPEAVEPAPTDLDSIRDELRRRNEEGEGEEAAN